MMQSFTTSDGLSLAYRDEGEGPAVLCLAGLTRAHDDFDEMAAHISGMRLIRMDYRGRGGSDFDPNPMNYAVPVEARDALELLDHLGLDKAAIIGTSRGGIIAMFLAVTAKHRLTGVLLNDVGPVLDKADLGRIVDYVGRNPPYRDYDEAARKYPDEMTGFANVTPERWRLEVERLWRIGENGLEIRYDPELRQSVMAAMDAPGVDLWPLFDALEGLPLALLRGANSQLLTPETVAEMRARRPDMLFAQVPDRAHIPFLDEPESLALIGQFLEKIP
ncbi:MAG: alpha/beta hydrolase [Alphaproteobacteria bacterium]|nr:alpha/beta hydrolase [Alphaproteobacteria bacterium]